MKNVLNYIMRIYPLKRLSSTCLIVALLWGLGAATSLAQEAGTITLIGTVSQQCNLLVTAAPVASNLDLSSGNKRIQIGSVVQNCNKRAGYTLHVQSQNCAGGTPGAKLIGTIYGESLRYSVEFNNPTTGGSQATVTGLLADACSGAAAVIGRNVTNSQIKEETSFVFVNYSGNSQLAADSYTDTITITLVVK